MAVCYSQYLSNKAVCTAQPPTRPPPAGGRSRTPSLGEGGLGAKGLCDTTYAVAYRQGGLAGGTPADGHWHAPGWPIARVPAELQFCEKYRASSGEQQP